jgi:SAM-dependent methyltransferase
MQALKLSKSTQEKLRCPICKSQLIHGEDKLVCIQADCGKKFPIIDDIPVLINEKNSIFSVDDFVSRTNTTFNLKKGRFKKYFLKLIPNISKSIKSEENYDKFARLLLTEASNPKVLIIGGSILGQGIENLTLDNSLELIESDVSFGIRTMIIFDAHDIPFQNDVFDGVIVQAVLEHVVDPYRCVEEIYRVLKGKGLVYSETPFMQQVHMGRYDFTRFTHLGHRRLFRKFDEIESGAVCGPGMALAWAYQAFLLSFTSSKILRKLIVIFTRFTSFYFKYFDYFLIEKPGAFDAASGYYFIGQKTNHILSDRQLIQLYKGAMQD